MQQRHHTLAQIVVGSGWNLWISFARLNGLVYDVEDSLCVTGPRATTLPIHTLDEIS